MHSLSRRIQALDASGIRRVFDLAQTLDNPCNLSIGQPHFDLHDSIKEAAKEAIDKGYNQYTQTQGIAPLREKLLAQYAAEGAPQEALFITSAVSGGFMLALMALCDAGDEIILPDPYFVFWKGIAQVTGVNPIMVDTYPGHCSSSSFPPGFASPSSNRFEWKKEQLERAISVKTRAIVLSSPANPTGTMATEKELIMIAEVAAKHDLWVIYDEIYKTYTYDRPYLSMSRYYPKTITLGGFSKSHSMTGWRIGSAAGPEAVIQAMIKLQQYSFVCAPSIAQWAAIEAIDCPLNSRMDDYKAKRDHMVRALSPYYNLTSPDGAFYLFIEAPSMTGDQFVLEALKHQLILVPGHVFSERDTHFRLSYANTDAMLDRGIEILKKMASETSLSFSPPLAEVSS